MNIERKTLNSMHKSNQKNVKEKEIFLSERGKLQSENIIDKKNKNNAISINNNSTKQSIVNQIIPISENKIINFSKRQNNNQRFGSTQKKLFTNSSLKNLDINSNNIKNNLKKSNFNIGNNNLGSPNINSILNNNNLNIGKFGGLSNSNTNSTSNLHLNIKEQDESHLKEKEIINPLKNTNDNNKDTNLQKISLLNEANLINADREFHLDNKSLISPNNFINVLPNSNHNSVNNISTNSDSNHIKVVVRFRPMNTVENVSYFQYFQFIIIDYINLYL